MSNLTSTSVTLQDFAVLAPPSPASEERFAERRRIVLLENDRALCNVITRSLLRLGCVVTFKRSYDQVLCALREANVHGVVMALELDGAQLAALTAANSGQVPIVVLTHAPPAPHQADLYPSLRLLQKPFDMRELFTLLNLPQQAKIVRAES